MDARRFLFDTCFDPVALPEATAIADDAQTSEPVVEEPPPPTFSEEEVMEARARGYADGEADGRSAAEAAAEAELVATLTRLGEQIALLIECQAESDAALKREAALFAVAMVRRLQPELARRHGLEEIEAVIRECLSGLLNEPRLIVRIPTSQADMLAPRIVEMAEEMGFEGRLDIRPDDNLSPGDGRLQWAEGGAERIAATVLTTVDAAMARLFDANDAPAALPPADIGVAEPTPAAELSLAAPSPDEARS